MDIKLYWKHTLYIEGFNIAISPQKFKLVAIRAQILVLKLCLILCSVQKHFTCNDFHLAPIKTESDRYQENEKQCCNLSLTLPFNLTASHEYEHKMKRYIERLNKIQFPPKLLKLIVVRAQTPN